jgi:secondary thiamine-phosphate synthase enzyme
MWYQTEFSLKARSRGFHLITVEVVAAIPKVSEIRAGILFLFLQHTSASLTINENADRDVRTDMELFFNRLAPESGLSIRHTIEGPDDMPAHVKSSILGCSLQIPICNGELALGTWQGIYLGEHRNNGGARRVLATLWGE